MEDAVVAHLMSDLDEKREGETRRPAIPTRKDLSCIERAFCDWGRHPGSTSASKPRASLSPERRVSTANDQGRRSSPSIAGGQQVEPSPSAIRPSRGVSTSALLHLRGNSPASPSAHASTRGYFRQKGFGIANRPPIHSGTDCKLGPGTYNTHLVGAFTWLRESHSHPAQKQLHNHRSAQLTTFGKPKTEPGGAPLIMSNAPGPGHYALPDLWDPLWQRYPPTGVSFARNAQAAGESRFGGMARGLEKTTKGQGDMDFIAG